MFKSLLLAAHLALLGVHHVCAMFVGPYTGIHSLRDSDQATFDIELEEDPRKLYPANTFAVPIDHFHNDSRYLPHTSDTFPLRYWFDASYWKRGGPVIVLASGETSGEDRLPYLQKGILHKLIKATNGLGVIIEHRYYGDSMPTEDLSVHNLRFLDTQQALADHAYFAKHIIFPGLEWETLTSDWTPWIVYGGSYAGAFAAFLRKLYPDIYWGAISSSGVPAAIVDYWEYWEAVRLYAPKECVSSTQDFMQITDGILFGQDVALRTKLKVTFGLQNVTDESDFAAAISSGVGSWQSRVWDPKVGSPVFDWYCNSITSSETLHSGSKDLAKNVKELIEAEGSLKATESLVTRMLNWISFLNDTIVQPCAKAGITQDECVGTHNASFWEQDDLDQYTWRSWTWQYCTQWGYFQTGSSIPPTIRPIVSRFLTMEFMRTPCRLAFNLNSEIYPDVESINQYGNFNISYPRLAFVDGQADPWKWAGVHAPGAPKRTDGVVEPFVEIEGAVHHWDEYGLFKNETSKGSIPAAVVLAQEYEAAFVKMWAAEYIWKCRWGGECSLDSTGAHSSQLIRPMPDPKLYQDILTTQESYER